ncbi:MAG: sigma-70 family RNA polymerase sigma factor [Lachnospiraceae bacterium]|nr:sigma-70 family RNA polymerase sigma factor [Lachnospiraceae bacterium]
MINQYIRDYGKRLYGLCTFLCANSYEAEDLYQETWLKVVKNIEKFDPSKEFEPWLTSICVNTYRNTLRRILKSPVFNTFTTTEEKEDVINSVPAPEGCDYSDLYAAIDKLPEKLRLTVLLFYFRDMDIDKTATVLGIPPGTVKSRLNKARKLLKEVLTDETDLQL